MDLKEIALNPKASHEEVRFLAQRVPRAAARHPNCPPDLWRELARRYPLDARENPTLLLYSLEDPMLYSWEALEREYVDDWVKAILPTLSEKDRQLWIAECIERALPLFESVYPGDYRPRAAIQARRAFASGLSNQKKLKAAQGAAGDAAWAATGNSAENGGSIAKSAGYAAWGAAWHDGPGAASYAAKAAALHAENDGVEMIEKIWQWHRLLQYKYGKA